MTCYSKNVDAKSNKGKNYFVSEHHLVELRDFQAHLKSFPFPYMILISPLCTLQHF